MIATTDFIVHHCARTVQYSTAGYYSTYYCTVNSPQPQLGSSSTA